MVRALETETKGTENGDNPVTMNANVRYIVLVFVFLALFIGSTGTVATASIEHQPQKTTETDTTIRMSGVQASQLNHSNNSSFRAVAPTKNVSRELIVHISERKNTTTKIEVKIAYPARSEAEADAAENGSFNPEWFDGSELIHQIIDRTSDGEAYVRSVSNGTIYSDRNYHDGSVERQHGRVILYTDAWIVDLTAAGEDVVIGPAYHRSLANSSTGSEWTLEVTVHKSWEPSVMNGDPITRPVGHVLDGYIWENVTSQTGTLLEFDSPITETTTDTSGPFGLAGGALLTGLAILVVASLKGTFA